MWQGSGEVNKAALYQSGVSSWSHKWSHATTVVVGLRRVRNVSEHMKYSLRPHFSPKADVAASFYSRWIEYHDVSC